MKIDKAIADFDMLKQGDKILVGLSGGADSIALAHYLFKVLKIQVIACHINHNLRGDESDRDAEFVKKTCDSWGMECHVKSVDCTGLATKAGISIEEAGRELRYAEFERLSKEAGATKVATAHTLSDSIETMLINLTRGCSLAGLCGIPPVRDKIVRPLIYSSRAEIEEYCYQNSLEYVTDSTNLDDSFSRNAIRLKVIPELKKINPSFEQTAARCIKSLSVDRDYINSMLIAAQDDGKSLDINELLGQEKALKSRKIASFLEKNKISVSDFLIGKVEEMAICGDTRWEVEKNKFIVAKKFKISILIESKVEYFQADIDEGEINLPFGDKYEIKFEDNINKCDKIYKKLLYIELDYDKIIGKSIIRQKKDGDKIKLAHRGVTKSLKDIFVEAGLTAEQKSKTAVIADDSGVIGVVGFGVSEAVLVTDDTKRVLGITKK